MISSAEEYIAEPPLQGESVDLRSAIELKVYAAISDLSMKRRELTLEQLLFKNRASRLWHRAGGSSPAL